MLAAITNRINEDRYVPIISETIGLALVAEGAVGIGFGIYYRITALWREIMHNERDNTFYYAIVNHNISHSITLINEGYNRLIPSIIFIEFLFLLSIPNVIQITNNLNS